MQAFRRNDTLHQSKSHPLPPRRRLLFIVDEENQVTETNETNNTASLALPSCAKWKQPGVDGSFGTAGNWETGMIPSVHDCILLENADPGVTTMSFERLPPRVALDYIVAKLELKSGAWDFDFRPPPLENASTKRLSVSDPAGIAVHDNAKLIVSDGTLVTERLVLSDRVTMGSRAGTIEIKQDFDLSASAKEITVELFEESKNSDLPLIKVDGMFKAGGKLTLISGPNYIPRAGDRFRLIQFKTKNGTKSVKEIYELYRFKKYDPSIRNKNNEINKSLFWGLTFREDFAHNQFIEVLVLNVPTISSDGSTLVPPGNRGLVFITHGTESKIDKPTEKKRDIGELFDKLSEFEMTHGSGQWDVASLDWREYSTGEFDTLTFNPATSAQVGIGIGESLVHWLDFNAFSYSQLHLLSHSSGSWLVNRMMQLMTAKTACHVTVFDAYTSPSKIYSDCDKYLFCNRFEAFLGENADANDFFEQYLDTSPASPPGTDDYLPLARNFDVTLARIDSAPKQTSTIDPIAAHAWPYKWYLETIRYAGQARLLTRDLRCAGFALSPEFLDSKVPLLSADSTLEFLKFNKDSLKNNTVLVIADSDCNSLDPSFPAFKLIQWTEKIKTSIFGSFKLINDGSSPGLLMELGTGGSIGPRGLALPLVDSAANVFVTADVQVPHRVSAFSCGFMFTTAAGGVLSISVDGTLLKQIQQDFVGPNTLSSGSIGLRNPLSAGPHQITFSFQAAGQTTGGVFLSNLQFGFDLRAQLDAPTLTNDKMPLVTFTGVPGTDYLIQRSSNLTNWTLVTNSLSTNWVHQLRLETYYVWL